MTSLASALSFLRCARANVADAAAELELTDRHDAALLVAECARVDLHLRALESALIDSADRRCGATGDPWPGQAHRPHESEPVSTFSAAVAPSLHPMPSAGRDGGHLLADGVHHG